MASDCHDFDPVSDETLRDPAAVHGRLRALCPVSRSDRFGYPLYSLASRDHVHRALSGPQLFSTKFGPGIPYDSDRVGDFNREDPPEHNEWRKYVRPEFRPRTLTSWEPRTRAVAGKLIDDVVGDRRADFAERFAYPLPITILIELLGVDPEDAGRIKAWADELALTLADADAGAAALQASRAYIRELAVERRRLADAAGMPGEEAVGVVVPAGWISTYALRCFRGERLPIEHLCNLVVSLMTAGHETTTSLLTNLVWRLLEVRSRWERLLADRSLIEVAVEESLRFDPPVLGLCRTNTDVVSLDEHELPVDTKILVLFASANRDAALFDDPDTFSLDRDLDALRRHYSFGWGVHLCAGAPLARMTGRVALEVLLDRLPDLRLDGPTERIEPALLWGRRRLPVAW